VASTAPRTPTPRVAAPVSGHRAAEAAARLIAIHQQHAIDAEVRPTRRALVQEIRYRHGVHAVAFLDEDFLAAPIGQAAPGDR
jgi:hypothetical protein